MASATIAIMATIEFFNWKNGFDKHFQHPARRSPLDKTADQVAKMISIPGVVTHSIFSASVLPSARVKCSTEASCDVAAFTAGNSGEHSRIKDKNKQVDGADPNSTFAERGVVSRVWLVSMRHSGAVLPLRRRPRMATANRLTSAAGKCREFCAKVDSDKILRHQRGNTAN